MPTHDLAVFARHRATLMTHPGQVSRPPACAVSHSYADPGTYTVTVIATDSQGDASTVTLVITVIDIDQPPSLAGVPRQVVVEGRTWTLQPIAFDPDAQTSLTFTLENAPPGMSIDPNRGEINWTPQRDQGPATYDFAVVATGQSRLSGRLPIVIDVVDSGSIGGTVFSDVDGNGMLDAVNEPLVGAIVRLDVGDNGSFDQLARTDANGAFRCDLLPVGLYRVVATLPAGWESTTPTEILVDMPVSESIEIVPFIASHGPAPTARPPGSVYTGESNRLLRNSLTHGGFTTA